MIPATVTIVPDTCARCGRCVAECPTEALAARPGELPTLDAMACIGCGHCGAVCGPGAIRSALGPFPEWQPPTLPVASAKSFLVGRRSTRRYRTGAVSRETIDDILSVGPYAPTASNAQDVTATVFTGEAVHPFACLVNQYYRGLVRLLSCKPLWPVLWFTALRPYLSQPGKLASVRRRVNEFGPKNDWVFFGAPVVVVLSTPAKHRLFGRVNCTIAAERMMQYAQALGFGSCYIGYADVALQRHPRIARILGMDARLTPHVVFTLGMPSSTYPRLPARRPITTTYRS